MENQMEDLKKFFQDKDRYAKHSGIELLDLAEGYAKTRMVIDKYHLNCVGTVHGGAVFTLADFAFAAACNSHGTIAMALQANISFLKSAVSGEVLIAEAKEVSSHPRIRLYSIEIKNETGDLIATFQGTAYRKKEAVPIESNL